MWHKDRINIPQKARLLKDLFIDFKHISIRLVYRNGQGISVQAFEFS